MAQNRKIIIGLAVGVVIATAFFVAWPRGTAAPHTPPTSITDELKSPSTFTLIISNPSTTIPYVEVSPGQNLFEIMKSEAAYLSIPFEYKEYPGMGVLITRIGDKKNGEQGKYWQYWVNGAYAEKGPDSYMVKPGDTIEWKFLGSEQ